MKPLDPFSIPLTGVGLVDASAGTGKTHTIATLFLRLVVERALEVDRILVVTFTKAATAELRDRIRRRLAEALAAFESGNAGSDEILAGLLERTRDRNRARRKLLAAVASADEAAVFTIHGFCQRVLEEHAFESGGRFDLSLVPDISPLVLEIVRDFWNRRLPEAPAAVVAHFRRRRKFGDLVRLGLLAARTQDVPVVATEPPADVGRYFDDYFGARKALIAQWSTARDAVAALLHGSPALSRNSYSSKIIIRIIEAMDELAKCADDAFGDFSEDLVKLGARKLAASVTRGGAPPRHVIFDLCDEVISARARAASALEAWSESFERDLVFFVREQLPVRAEQRGILSFDDLLHNLHGALVGPHGKALAAAVRRRFAAAVIDEFHDTDPLQYDIFRRIYGGATASLLLIGDPKQAIYAFRGADVYAYITASHDADRRFTLTTNHRSDPSLIRAVNTLFSRVESPFILDEIPFDPVMPKKGAADAFGVRGVPSSGLDVLFVPRAESEGSRGRRGPSPDVVPDIVARDIATLLGSGATIAGRPVRAGDIAVLTRRNLEARDVQAALRAYGVTGVLHGDSSVLDTDEAAEMAAVLRALADPANPTAVRSALATNLLGQSATELFELGEDESAWERWTSNFGRWHEIWKARGILAAVRRLISDEAASARLLGAPGGERLLTNYLHLVELLHKQAVERHSGMAGLIAWFDEVRHKEDARGGVAPEAQQVRLESDELAVQLTTMHRSKGLEYPIVYLPYLWRSASLFPSDRLSLLYHDRSHDNRLVLDLRAESEKGAELEAASRESLAEAQRLTYVALTRGKHRAVVVWGPFYRFEESSLAKLFHARSGDLARAPDADLVRDLNELARDSAGAITVRSWSAAGSVSPVAPPVGGPDLLARELPSRRLTTRRTSSFTGLSSGHDVPESPVDDARDVDDAPIEVEPTRGGEFGTLRVDREDRVPLDEFPRGPRAGDALHGILEKIDFERSDPAELARVSEEELTRHGIDAPRWSELVAHSLDDVLRTPLLAHESELALASIPASRRRPEMEFTFPVGSPERRRGAPLTATGLANALRTSSTLPADYADRVASLGFVPLTGFLRGFIDLVLEHQGRFFVVDYKSNHLGASPEHYAREALRVPMAEHHYFLQYHLYAVAVHRYLGARVPSYAYNRHFGGVLYLFLRGMSPERGPRTGVFFDRPSEQTVGELSRVLQAAPPEGP